MDFFEKAGKMAVGTRVRLLAEKISADAAEIYRAYDTNLQPKWFPVFFILAQGRENTVTSIAAEIGHSHVSVSKIIGEMSKAGLITERTNRNDRRSTKISLSKTGLRIARKMKNQYEDVTAAIDEISSEANHDLWAALSDWEKLLHEKSLLDRVLARKKRREPSVVRIVPYRPKYREAFRNLNEEWIKTYFKMEKPDHDALDNPEKYILNRRGSIFVALKNQKPVGVCALLWRDDIGVYELAKMAVSPAERGNGIGYLLGQAVIEKAKSIGADRLFLESNTVLKPAIRLYHKLGFRKMTGPPTPYERCNIQMELMLKKSR